MTPEETRRLATLLLPLLRLQVQLAEFIANSEVSR